MLDGRQHSVTKYFDFVLYLARNLGWWGACECITLPLNHSSARCEIEYMHTPSPQHTQRNIDAYRKHTTPHSPLHLSLSQTKQSLLLAFSQILFMTLRNTKGTFSSLCVVFKCKPSFPKSRYVYDEISQSTHQHGEKKWKLPPSVLILD